MYVNRKDGNATAGTMRFYKKFRQKIIRVLMNRKGDRKTSTHSESYSHYAFSYVNSVYENTKA